MATIATQVDYKTAAGPAVMRPVKATKPVCGECAFHMPHATRPGGWCACRAADLRWKPVAAGRAACSDFAIWPEDSPAPADIAAMGF